MTQSATSSPSLAQRIGMSGPLRFTGDKVDYLYIDAGEVLKIFRPKPRLPIGGGVDESILDGKLGFLLKPEDFSDRGQSNAVIKAHSATLCPLINFPRLVELSTLESGMVSDEFCFEFRRVVDAIPSRSLDIARKLGANFFSRDPAERIFFLAKYLRAV